MTSMIETKQNEPLTHDTRPGVLSRAMELYSSFKGLSAEFSGIVPEGKFKNLGIKNWGHGREDWIGTNGVNSVVIGAISKSNHLALCSDGLRVVHTTKKVMFHNTAKGNSDHGAEESIGGAPSFVAAIRLAYRGFDTASLRQEILKVCENRE